MLDPFDPNKNTGSYVNLQRRIFQRVQSSGINDQIIESVRKSYEDAVNAEIIVLSRSEKRRLFSQVVKLVLEDMLKELDNRPL